MKILLTILATIAAFSTADENALQQILADGNNQFTTKLFSEVVKENPAQSFVLSAFSVLPPLAQLALASVGESHDELLHGIGLKDDDTIKAVFSTVNSKLRSVKGITLNMANRVYINETAHLNEEFAKISKDVFQSEVKKVDFKKSVETAKEINAWVEDQTNHRIKNLVSPDSLDATTCALLVNALYFKGKWSHQFDKALTSDQDFHVNKDTTIKVPTMQKLRGSYKYGESPELNAKLLELLYEGDEASFLVVLPNEVDGLAALEEKLKDPSALSKAIESMQTVTVDVFLPKFKIETTTNLKDVLQKIHIKKLFSVEARLEHLLNDTGALYVSEAIQKAFIEVNEEGAEAAAANEFIIPMMAPMVQPQHFIFKADKPFYYEIRTNFNANFIPPTVTLFNGILSKP